MFAEDPEVLDADVRLGEDGLAESLDDESLPREGGAAGRQVGIVHVARPVGLDRHQAALDVELAGDEGGAHGEQPQFGRVFGGGEGIPPTARLDFPPRVPIFETPLRRHLSSAGRASHS